MKTKYLFPVFVCIGTLFFACKKKNSDEFVPAAVADFNKSGDSAYVLSYGGLSATINFAEGGRLETLSLNGQNFLSPKSVNATNWGTSFWPSPQSAWGLSPSQQLDSLPYITVNANPLTIQSQRDPKLGYVFKKMYVLNTYDTSLTITYTIVNDRTISQKVAPWEISRVAPGGLTFYPKGTGTKSGALVPLTKDSIAITWFKYDSTTIPSDVPELIADGNEGWLAKVSNGLILVKSFPAVAATSQAPGEGEIKIYANPDKSYLEIENQGAYVTLEAGKSLTYKVTYKLRKVPSSVPVVVGDKKLAAYARSLHK